MSGYAIIETDDGMTVVRLERDQNAEQAALKRGGYVVDPGPYGSYQDAYDALLALAEEDEDDPGL